MNYSELVRTVAREAVTNPPQMVVRDVLDAALATIMDEVAEGREVKLSNFGKFDAHDRPPRVARNPKTGEEVSVAARRVARFRPAKMFREVANGE